MITYQTFLQTNPDPILNQSDETVQQAVEDWFKYRYIGFEDTAKFLNILQRNVAVNYPIYQQKLRIQPGISNYDWLVTTYRERQYGTKGNTTNKTVRGNDTVNTQSTDSGTSSTTYGRTNTHTKTGTVGVDETTTDSNVRTGGETVAHSADGTNVRTGGQTDTKNDSSTTVKTGNDVSAREYEDTTTRTGGQTNVKSGNETGVKSGGHTEEDVAGLHTQTTSPHVSTRTTTKNGRSEFSGDDGITADLPLSQSYSSFESGDDATSSSSEETQQAATRNGMPTTLSWNTATNQAQNSHKGYVNEDNTQTTSYVYGDDVTGDILTTQGDATDPDKKTVTYNNETDTRTYNNITDKLTYDSVKDAKSGTDSTTHTYNDVSDATTGSGTETTVYDNLTDTKNESGTDTTTYNSLTDTGNGTKKSTTTYNTTDTDTEGGTDSGATSNTKSGETTSVYGNIDVTTDDSRVDQEIVTGRDGDPATLLARATAFIEGSSAWKWLREQLDSCFFPGYYTEEDFNGDTEGSCLI